MLRITPHVARGEYVITIEGSLSGPWVTELAASWIAAATEQPGRRIRLDLADVGHVDQAGRELLTLMYRAGVRFAARGFVMPQLVREISRSVQAERRS
jgi:hypothetical protein